MRAHSTLDDGLPRQSEGGMAHLGTSGRNRHQRQLETPVRQRTTESEGTIRTKRDRTTRQRHLRPWFGASKNNHLGIHPEPKVFGRTLTPNRRQALRRRGPLTARNPE
jgi:hypothetical protein